MAFFCIQLTEGLSYFFFNTQINCFIPTILSEVDRKTIEIYYNACVVQGIIYTCKIEDRS